MQRRLQFTVLALTLAVLGNVAPSAAQIDVDLAFTPDVVAPGEPVNLRVSLANLGSERVAAALELSVALGSRSIGPLPGRMSLAADATRIVDMPFVAPPVAAGEVLTITLSAMTGEFADTASATLTISGDPIAPVESSSPRALADGLFSVLLGPMAAEPATLSQVKDRYR